MSSSIIAQSLTQIPPQVVSEAADHALARGRLRDHAAVRTSLRVMSPASVSPVEVGSSMVEALASVVGPVPVDGGVSWPPASCSPADALEVSPACTVRAQATGAG